MMLEKIGLLVIGVLIGAAILFFMKPKPEPTNSTAWQGEIRAVQKHISVEIPVGYSELVTEEEGAGTGKAMMETNYTLEIGVQFPDAWKAEVQKSSDGVVEITIPKLTLLNEIKTEIEDYSHSICNKPTGKQTRMMEEKFKAHAKKAFVDRANEYLLKNKNIYELSRNAFESYYLNILNSVNKTNPARLVHVKFEGEPSFK